jgi:ribosomal protein S18 acetylase RimI-like enzyme
MTIVIRHAKIKDLSNILEIERLSFFDNCFSKRAVKYHIQKNLVLVAVCDLQICGMIIVSSLTKKKNRRIYSIAVHPNYKNIGVGIKLLQHTEKISKAKCITLEVDMNNIAAINLYNKLNFFKFNIYEHYYGHTLHAIRMKKILY